MQKHYHRHAGFQSTRLLHTCFALRNAINSSQPLDKANPQVLRAPALQECCPREATLGSGVMQHNTASSWTSCIHQLAVPTISRY